MAKREYKCAMCGGIFDSHCSDEEAVAEMKRHYGQSFEVADCAIVCEVCYQKIHPEKHPHAVEEAVAEKARRVL